MCGRCHPVNEPGLTQCGCNCPSAEPFLMDQERCPRVLFNSVKKSKVPFINKVSCFRALPERELCRAECRWLSADGARLAWPPPEGLWQIGSDHRHNSSGRPWAWSFTPESWGNAQRPCWWAQQRETVGEWVFERNPSPFHS